MIFDIKRFSINDGPGIRTTIFFKGCQLNCLWCHNPESKSFYKQIMFLSNRCGECKDICIINCESKAISRVENKIIINEQCNLCFKCEELCKFDAVKIVGKEYSVNELFVEIIKDRIFYDSSDGGVTFSGGEPLSQIIFLTEILKKCKENEIHTAIDTSGYSLYESFVSIMDYCDLFLYDLKIINDQNHIKYTGVSNKIILSNLEKLYSVAKEIIIRIPLIDQITSTKENIFEIIEYLQNFPLIKKISLLNYHKSGLHKFENNAISNKLKDIQPLNTDELLGIQSVFEKNNFIVSIGE